METPPLQSSGRKWFVDFLMRGHRWLLALAVLLTAFAIPPAGRLSFDRSIESLYAQQDPHLIEYRQSQAWFGGDDFVFVAYADPDLMSEAGLSRVAALTDEIGKMPGVVPESIQSLSDLMNLSHNPMMRRRLDRLMEFGRGVVVSEDQQTTAIMLRLQADGKDGRSHAQTLSALRDIAARQSIPTYVVGEPVLVHDMFDYAESDGYWMGWAATGLLTMIILVFLRDLRSIVLPFVIVQVTIVWTRATLETAHMQLTMVSSILGSLVTVIGVSTVVYTSLYYRTLRESLDRESAIRQMLTILGIDIVWVCCTTATGFSAQLTSHIHPVRSFGITMVFGSLFVLLAMTLILPSGLLLGPDRSQPPRPRGDRHVNRGLLIVTEWVLAHPGLIWSATVAIVSLSIAGLLQLNVETDFSKNFRANTPVVRSLDFVEHRLGGSGAWEVNFPAPAELTEEFLDRIRNLAQKLRELKIGDKAAMTKVLALTDGMDLIPKVPRIVPDFQSQLRKLRELQPEFEPSLLNPSDGRMRIMLRSLERQPSEDKQRAIALVTSTACGEFPDAKVTGLYVLLTYLIDSLLHDQWIDLLTAAGGLMLMMSLAYRSLRLGVISLVPNILPMILLLGGMGWSGVPINIGTAIISSDAMGLTIHDSIFYISAYRRARLSGLDFRGALHEVQTEVRKPLVYSNIALILGFLVLTTSHFVPLIYFGVLVSVAIAGGLIINLLLLPLLLKMIDSKFDRATSMTDN